MFPIYEKKTVINYGFGIQFCLSALGITTTIEVVDYLIRSLLILISKLELEGKYDLTKKAIITFVVKNEIPSMGDSPTILHN